MQAKVNLIFVAVISVIGTGLTGASPQRSYYDKRVATNPYTGEGTSLLLPDMFVELLLDNHDDGSGRKRPAAALALEACAAQAQIPVRALQQQLTDSSDEAAQTQVVHNLLMEAPSAQDALCIARALRNRPEVNARAWAHGLISAILSRPDMASLSVDKSQAGVNGHTQGTQALSSVPVVSGEEARLWYWRNDPLLNSGHWHWHLAHPANGTDSRRGELFYFFHHGILARYHAERLANDLAPLVTASTRASTMGRKRLLRSRSRRTRQLNSVGGFNKLAESVISLESKQSDLFTDEVSKDAMKDPLFYVLLDSIDDRLDQAKLMLAPYAPEGGDWPLHWPEVEVTDVRVVSEDQPWTKRGPNKLVTFWNYDDCNQTQALAPSVCPDGQDHHLDHRPFSYQITLNRRTGYAATVWGVPATATGQTTPATVRIFMAPRYDHNGRRYAMSEQRRYFFPMDHFSVDLQPGRNVIERRSVDSALTMPTEASTGASRSRTITSEPLCGCGWPQHLLIPKGTQKGQVFDLFVIVTNGEQDQVTNVGGGNGFCNQAPHYCGIGDEYPYPDARPLNYPFDRAPYSRLERSNSTYYPYPFFPSVGVGAGTSAVRVRGTWRTVRDLDEYTNGVSNMGMAQVTVMHADNSLLHPPLGQWSEHARYGGQWQWLTGR